MGSDFTSHLQGQVTCQRFQSICVLRKILMRFLRFKQIRLNANNLSVFEFGQSISNLRFLSVILIYTWRNSTNAPLSLILYIFLSLLLLFSLMPQFFNCAWRNYLITLGLLSNYAYVFTRVYSAFFNDFFHLCMYFIYFVAIIYIIDIYLLKQK